MRTYLSLINYLNDNFDLEKILTRALCFATKVSYSVFLQFIDPRIVSQARLT